MTNKGRLVDLLSSASTFAFAAWSSFTTSEEPGPFNCDFAFDLELLDLTRLYIRSIGGVPLYCRSCSAIVK